MCGIWALFGIETDVAVHSNAVFSKISHRGPDAWRVEADCRMAVSIGMTLIRTKINFVSLA